VAGEDLAARWVAWHRAIHQVTGSIALRSNRATREDVERWAAALRKIADEMEAEIKSD
jgi:hypothetical protein